MRDDDDDGYVTLARVLLERDYDALASRDVRLKFTVSGWQTVGDCAIAARAHKLSQAFLQLPPTNVRRRVRGDTARNHPVRSLHSQKQRPTLAAR